ncbi:MAG: tetraacyldisaccharide 4'-kinase [Flavobacteriales bacterium]
MSAWRWIFFPFGLVYWVIAFVRNACYDASIFSSHDIEGTTICIGNLNVGGSGKSPLTLYLMKVFQATHTIQVVSRGYGRKTRGHIQLNGSHGAADVGDEPLMYFKQKKPLDEIHVAEHRLDAIRHLKRDSKHLLLLDDAFQHRKVRAGFSLLVSDFNAPFFSDFILPIGNLREPRMGARRADLVLFTKCPDAINDAARTHYIQQATKHGLKAFFSRITYAPLKAVNGFTRTEATHVLLVTGIANPLPLKNHLEKSFEVHHLQFSDHHEFTREEINKIHKKFDTFDAAKTIIITTEKDFMRLYSPEFHPTLSAYPWFIQPIELTIEHESEFLTLIQAYVRKN